MKTPREIALSICKSVLTFHPKKNPTSKAAFLTIAIFGMALAASAATNIRERLISVWPLDALDGNTMPDAAFTNAMGVAGSPTLEPGRYGNAMTFGTGIYLTNVHPSSAFASSGLPIYSAGSYSICMWVKGSPQASKYLFTHASITSRNPLFLLQSGAGVNSAKFDFYLRTDGNTAIVNHFVSGSVILDNTWHHIAWVDDNGDAKLYVDGQLDPTNFKYIKAGSFTFHTTSIGVLTRTNSAASPQIVSDNPFTGQIDDVGIWERALSQEEVQYIAANGIPTDPMQVVLNVEPVSQTRQYQDWALFSTRAYARRAESSFTYQWFKNGSLLDGATARTYQTERLTPANSGEYYAVEVSNGIGSPVRSTNAYLTVLSDGPVNLTSGLVNYWPLDVVNEVGGSFLTPDLYSHADIALTNDMTPLNLMDDSHKGKSLYFDGLTNIAYRVSGDPISISSAYSISMWVRGDYMLQNDRRVFSEGTATNVSPLMTLGTQSTGASNSAAVFIRSTSGTTGLNSRPSVGAVFDDTWHHIVWTDSGGQGRLYIDGVLDWTDYTYSPSPRVATITSLGGVMRAGTGNFFYGYIDEVATWGRALSWSEIQEVYLNGVPEPPAVLPPFIAAHPVSRTNAWIHEDVTFTAVVSGTSPALQWYKNDSPIPSALNPTAVTESLVLTNISVADNGFYYLRATNSAGATNSLSAQLLAKEYTPVLSGEAVKIDVGLDGSPNLQPGFDEFTLGINGTNYGGPTQIGVTISPLGSVNFASRNRVLDAPVSVTNLPPLLTQASLYNDFIYVNSSATNVGMRILIERLAPNTPYGVTIWSYDRYSTGRARSSYWLETASGTPIPVAPEHTFSGSIPPTNDFQYTLGGLFTSSPQGKLQFEGRSMMTNDVGVFFNAIRLVANPAGTKVKALGVQEGNLMMQVEGDYQGQPITLEESSALAPASWAGAVGANPVLTNGPAVIYQIPISSTGSKFYRAASQPPQ